MRLRLFLAALSLPFAAPLSAALAPGAKAPDFTTQGAINGRVFNLTLSKQLANGPVVLYFFPAAFTPGCNAEAKAFADATAAFKAAGATVIGMSADPVDRLAEFSTAHCAGKFAVASAGPDVVANYDVAMPGRRMTSRTSYVIARDGRIAYAHSDPSPAGHITGTLAAVRKLKPAR